MRYRLTESHWKTMTSLSVFLFLTYSACMADVVSLPIPHSNAHEYHGRAWVVSEINATGVAQALSHIENMIEIQSAELIVTSQCLTRYAEIQAYSSCGHAADAQAILGLDPDDLQYGVMQRPHGGEGRIDCTDLIRGLVAQECPRVYLAIGQLLEENVGDFDIDTLDTELRVRVARRPHHGE
jgi:hypothetical protein